MWPKEFTISPVKFWNFSLWTPRTLTRHHDLRSACAPSSRARPAWCVGSGLGCGLPWQTGPEFPRSQPAAVGPPRCPDTASPAACPPGLYLSNTVIKRVGTWPRAGPRNKIQKAQQLPLEHGAPRPHQGGGWTDAAESSVMQSERHRRQEPHTGPQPGQGKQLGQRRTQPEVRFDCPLSRVCFPQSSPRIWFSEARNPCVCSTHRPTPADDFSVRSS